MASNSLPSLVAQTPIALIRQLLCSLTMLTNNPFSFYDSRGLSADFFQFLSPCQELFLFRTNIQVLKPITRSTNSRPQFGSWTHWLPYNRGISPSSSIDTQPRLSCFALPCIPCFSFRLFSCILPMPGLYGTASAPFRTSIMLYTTGMKPLVTS